MIHLNLEQALTRPRLETIVCAVHGPGSDIFLRSGGITLGPPDFDTRPAEMARFTVGYWVQECAHCGYAARDIVLSGAYQRIRTCSEAPPDARRRPRMKAVLLHQLAFIERQDTGAHPIPDAGPPPAGRKKPPPAAD